MLALLGLIVSAMPLGMTPQVELATDFIHYYEMNAAMVSDLRYFDENEDHCFTEEPYFLFENRTQKVECDEVYDYFKDQYLEIGSLAYKIAGQCEELYSTNNRDLCLIRNSRELTKSVNELESLSDF